MANSPAAYPSDTQLVLHSDAESSLSSVIYDLSHQMQAAMESMLKMINEIDQNSAGVMEDIERCKESALEKKKALDEEKERFQKAAYSVLDMLNNRDIN